MLVVGDPFAATTHSDIVIRAHEKNIPVTVIHNASIMSAVASCGLQVYLFVYICIVQNISICFVRIWYIDIIIRLCVMILLVVSQLYDYISNTLCCLVCAFGCLVWCAFQCFLAPSYFGTIIFATYIILNYQLYSFGPTISIPFWTENWRPDSFYDKLKLNQQLGFHTLCLLGM